MDGETKDRMREAARNRNITCGGCGHVGTEEVDGSDVGGLPGIRYRHCRGCGWSRAKTVRQKREKLL